jgi:hypothetical protein
MKKIISTMLFALVISVLSANAQNILNNVVNQATNYVNGSGSSVSNDEVIKGLKEALTVGTNNSTGKASKTDGFFKNPAIKIPFPPEVKKMESTLKTLGMTSQVNKFVETLNRAAEEASKGAATIFINAVTSMNVSDGIAILKGNNDAATQFLKNATTSELKTNFKPVVTKAIQKVQLLKYWTPLAKSYNKVPGVTKVNPNLEDYVTTKAIDGLFKLIADEEGKIRKDPAARVSELLKKIFS